MEFAREFVRECTREFARELSTLSLSLSREGRPELMPVFIRRFSRDGRVEFGRERIMTTLSIDFSFGEAAFFSAFFSSGRLT